MRGAVISIGEDRFGFALREEQDKADIYSEEQIATAKYAWQRVSPTLGIVPSGRLAIEMVDGYQTRRWADRARWSLADKLPELFALIEDRARQAKDQRSAAAQAGARRHELWEQAVPQARDRHVAELNQKRAIRRQPGERLVIFAPMRRRCAMLLRHRKKNLAV